MSKPKVYIRADGSSQIGLGHVIRCTALAHMLRAHFDCSFYIRNPSAYLIGEIEKSGCSVHPLPENVSYEDEAKQWGSTLKGNEIVVLDNYHFDTAYQQQIKTRGCKLVCIDDIHACRFVADAVINHAGGIAAHAYDVEPYTKLYLGLSYALLRPAFLAAAKATNEPISTQNALICLGGADPNNDTLKLLNELQAANLPFSYHLVLGGGYRFKNELADFLSKTTLNIQVYYELSEVGLADLMQQCLTAICSPSTVSIEYLCAKRGTLFLHQIAANQTEIYHYYIENRLAYSYEAIYTPKPYELNTIKLAELFDGNQQQRILSIFQTLAAQ